MKALLFDLDGTLFDRDTTVQRAIRRQYTDFQHALAGTSSERFVDMFIELDNHGHGAKDAVYNQLAWEFGVKPKIAEQMLHDFWRRYHDEAVAYPGLHQVLSDFKHRGFKLGLVTNGQDRIQNGTIDALGIRSYFHTIVISESAGVRKPNAAIFEMAASQLEVAMHEAVYVGDNPIADVAGALSAGMGAIWRRQPYWRAPKDDVPTIDRLEELMPLLGDELMTTP